MTMMNTGKADVALLINNKYDYVAIGTGSAPTATSTTLDAEVMRELSTNTRITTTVTNDTSQQTATFSIATGYALTNSAVFDESTGGVMLCGQGFSVINVIAGDTLITVWKEVVS